MSNTQQICVSDTWFILLAVV